MSTPRLISSIHLFVNFCFLIKKLSDYKSSGFFINKYYMIEKPCRGTCIGNVELRSYNLLCCPVSLISESSSTCIPVPLQFLSVWNIRPVAPILIF